MVVCVMLDENSISCQLWLREDVEYPDAHEWLKLEGIVWNLMTWQLAYDWWTYDNEVNDIYDIGCSHAVKGNAGTGYVCWLVDNWKGRD